ncbi:MAG: diacylglycerol kinase family lipid kinase [Candidatus Woesearchaeota archaeon]
MSNTCIVVNTKAGKKIFLTLYMPLVLAVFDEHNIKYTIEYTRSEGHAADIARNYKDKVDFFTVFGGDGTIKDVVSGMFDNPKPIGIIPFGTVNVLALDLGIPFDPIGAAHTIVQGIKKNIDVGVINQQPFILMASIGIDAEAVHNINLNFKKIFGKIAYITSAIKSLFIYRPQRLTVKILDKQIVDNGYIAIVSNSRFYGGRYTIDEDTKIDDGLLNVFLFKRGSIFDTFRLFMGVLTKTHSQMKDIEFYTTSKLLIYSKKKAKVQVDGDIACFPPLDISIKPSFLPVFVAEERFIMPEMTRKYIKRFFKKLIKERKDYLKHHGK